MLGGWRGAAKTTSAAHLARSAAELPRDLDLRRVDPQPYLAALPVPVLGAGTGWCTVTLNNATSVTATFSGTAQLTVTKAGSGSGVVTSIPAGVYCVSTCAAKFPLGTTVTLTALAPSGSVFTGWSGGGCSGTGTCVVSMTANATVTATFQSVFTLTVHAQFETYCVLTLCTDGGGQVVVTPGVTPCSVHGDGTDRTSTCTYQVPLGSSVTLTAQPESWGSQFVGWSAPGCASASTVCTVNVTGPLTVQATFTSAFT